MKKSFNAFTLAEVLITLGIIGVVAAMTMPTLINQTNGAQYKAAYKKALSAISQGVTLNVALDDVSFADTSAGSAGKTDKATDGSDTVASVLASRMNIVKATGISDSGYGKTGDVSNFPVADTNVCSEYETDGGGTPTTECKTYKNITPDTFLFFNDSSMLAFKNEDTYACTTDTYNSTAKICYGVLDINGVKGPNKVTACDNGTSGSSCTVSQPKDIYPVQFYDQTILPASDAANAVLYGK